MNPRLKGSLLVALSGICWSFSGVLSKNLEWSALSKAGVRSIVAVLMFAWVRKGFRLKLTKGTLIGGLGVALCCAGDSEGAELKHAHIGNLVALLSGVSFSVVFLASRVDSEATTDYTYLGNLLTVLMVFSLPFDPNVRFGFGLNVLKDWLLVVLMGVSLGLGYILLALGLKTASPLRAAVLENLEPALNPVWVFLFIGERPDLTGILGCGIILLSVVLFAMLPDHKAENAAEKDTI